MVVVQVPNSDLEEKKGRGKKKWDWEEILMVVPFLLFIGFTAFFVWKIEFRPIQEDQMVYETKSYDEQVTVSVSHVTREKGKEAVYTIDASYQDYEIPESIFEAYIGAGNNTITLHIEEMKIYTATNREFTTYNFYTAQRWSAPWEECAAPFSDSELKEFHKVLLERCKGENTLEIDVEMFSFEADFCGEGHGHRKNSIINETKHFNEGM